ncbi:hypothetical protein RYX36_015345 [Vicia faba]
MRREKTSKVSKDYLAVIPWVPNPLACKEIVPETCQTLKVEDREMMDLHEPQASSSNEKTVEACGVSSPWHQQQCMMSNMLQPLFAVNKRYEGLVTVRTKAIKDKGAWYWTHLEPILVRNPNSGLPKSVKLKCSLCEAVFSASNPSRTASEHLKRGTCSNFNNSGLKQKHHNFRTTPIEQHQNQSASAQPSSHRDRNPFATISAATHTTTISAFRHKPKPSPFVQLQRLQSIFNSSPPFSANLPPRLASPLPSSAPDTTTPDNHHSETLPSQPPTSPPLTIVVATHLIPGLKDYLLSQGTIKLDELGEDEMRREKTSKVSKDCLAVIPWVPNPLACKEIVPETCQTLKAEDSEMMDLDEPQASSSNEKTVEACRVSSPWQQQQCMMSNMLQPLFGAYFR